MTESFGRLRTRPRLGRSLWAVGGAGLLALCAWVPFALATPGRTSAPAPVNVQPPRVVGTAQGGQVLKATTGSWQGSTPMTFGFQWQVCGSSGCANVQGMQATDRIYAVATADVGQTIRVVVTATNRAGTASAPSQPTATVVAAPPSIPDNTRLPTIAGSLRAGATLSARPGQWIAPGPIRFLYQWRKCRPDGGDCVATRIASPTYTLQAPDLGHSFRVLVRAYTGSGPVAPLHMGAALSDPTPVVQPAAPPANTSPPTITGKAQAGELLTAHTGSWRSAGPITFKYQWLRCDRDHTTDCITLIGATQHRFNLGDKDVGHRMRVRVTAVNRAGSAQALSGSSDTVKARPVPGPANTKTPSISGSPVVGATLTANPGTWQGHEPITLTYEWLRCDAALKSCPPINGAAKTTYTLTSADIGHRLVVRVTAHNVGGISVASSSPTGVVQASTPPASPPPPPSTKGTMSIGQVALPDRLVVDRLQFTPSRITSANQAVIARFHVSETASGRPVQGALVYATGVPYNRLSNRPEVTTGSDGWATIRFRVLPTFKLRKGNLVVMFVRARKPGESVLAGVSTRRLVSVGIG